MAIRHRLKDETTRRQEQNGQNVRLSNSESAATVSTVRLNKDEKERAKKADEKLAVAERNKFVADSDRAAKAFQQGYSTLVKLNNQYKATRLAFVDLAHEILPELQKVRHFFAHKKDGELLLGKYSIGDDWSQGEFGISFRHVRRSMQLALRPPAERPLLPEESEEAAAENTDADAEEVVDAEVVEEEKPTSTAIVKTQPKPAAQVALEGLEAQDAQELAAFKAEAEAAKVELADLQKVTVSVTAPPPDNRADIAAELVDYILKQIPFDDGHANIETIRVIRNLALRYKAAGRPPLKPEPPNPKPRARKEKISSPRGMVNVDELPPDVREKVMSQIEATAAQPTDSQSTLQPDPEPKPSKAKQSKNEKKLEAVIDELRRIDSILDAAPVDDELGAYVDKSNYKLLDKQERLLKKLKLLEKAVEAEESDDEPTEGTEKMQATAA